MGQRIGMLQQQLAAKRRRGLQLAHALPQGEDGSEGD